MALKRRRDDKMRKEFFKFYFITITSGLLYLTLIVTCEPVCYTRIYLDERNRHIKRVDCNGSDKICMRFASRKEVNSFDIFKSPCNNLYDYPFRSGGSSQEKDFQECKEWNEWNEEEYKFISTVQTWNESRQLCENDNAQLVIIENEEENDFVYKMVLHCKPTIGGTWIGLKDIENEGMWKWSDGAVSTYRNWKKGQPDGGDTENCVKIIASNGKWNDLPCNIKLYAVCARNKPLK